MTSQKRLFTSMRQPLQSVTSDAEVIFERLAVAVETIDVAGFGDIRQDRARRKPAAYCAPVAQYPREHRGPHFFLRRLEPKIVNPI